MQKCLILLAFVSYEAVRLWWWGGNCGVVSFGKTPFSCSFPDLLTFHDAPTVIEQKLFVMFLEHRMRTFQGTFHANPDYAMWYGWSEMQRDLTEIKALAAQMRESAKTGEK
jgi:hypothetical protein